MHEPSDYACSAQKQRHGSPSRTLPRVCTRSEEHTSELQSQSNLVCRLLLEKKKEIICDELSRHYATRCVRPVEGACLSGPRALGAPRVEHAVIQHAAYRHRLAVLHLSNLIP